MRKKRFNNDRKFTLLRNSFIIAFILVCIFIGTGYSLLTTKIEIKGKATILAEEKKDDDTEISNSTANLTIDTSWGNNVIFKIIIKNQDEDIKNWNIAFDISEIPSSVAIYGLGDNLSITTSGNTIKVKETGDDWASVWNINTEKAIQFHMVFQSDVTKFSISNLIFNGKRINNFTSNTNSTVENKSSNEVTIELVDKQSNKEENEVVNNSISNNVSNQNTIKSGYENVNENEVKNTERNIINRNTTSENKINDLNEKLTENTVDNVIQNTPENNIKQNVINTN